MVNVATTQLRLRRRHKAMNDPASVGVLADDGASIVKAEDFGVGGAWVHDGREDVAHFRVTAVRPELSCRVRADNFPLIVDPVSFGSHGTRKIKHAKFPVVILKTVLSECLIVRDSDELSLLVNPMYFR